MSVPTKLEVGAMSLRLPPKEYAALCLEVLGRDGFKCRHCGWRQVSVHHIIFRSDQGPDASWNLVCLCEVCHSAVHRYELFISVPEDSWVGPGGGADKDLVFTR
jgi:hypothetical protein